MPVLKLSEEDERKKRVLMDMLGKEGQTTAPQQTQQSQQAATPFTQSRQQASPPVGTGPSGRADWQQNLQTISALKLQNPAQSPVAVGTPTASKNRFVEDTRRYDQDFGEGIRRYDQGFEEDIFRDRRDYEAQERHRAQQLALSKMSGSKQDVLSAVYSGIPARVRELTEVGVNTPLGIAGMPGLTRNETMSPEKAVESVIREIVRDFGATGASYNEFKNLVDFAYRSAGVAPPAEPNVKQMYDDMLYGSQFDYLQNLKTTNPAEFEQIIKGRVGGANAGSVYDIFNVSRE